MALQKVPVTAKQVINNWTSVTSEQLENVISSALSQMCQLDPAPTWLVKQYRQLLVPFVAWLFNESITTGAFLRNVSIQLSHRITHTERMHASAVN